MPARAAPPGGARRRRASRAARLAGGGGLAQLPATMRASRTVRPAYQGLIAQLDDHLGRVWEAMERLGRWKDTLVVFSSDHGDYLGDHWLGEKELFHDCVQRVPFLLYDPSPDADATRGAAEDRFVEAIDVVPTILDALALDAAPHLVEGRSLLPLTRGGGDAVARCGVQRARLDLPRRAPAARPSDGAAPRLDGARRQVEIRPLDQRPPPAALRPRRRPGGVPRPRRRSSAGGGARGDAGAAAARGSRG